MLDAHPHPGLTHLNPTIAAALAPYAPAAPRTFNDDDLYVVNLRTKTIVREYGVSSASAQVARVEGLPVKPGHALVTGMMANSLGLVS
ncbi:MAG: hypothetical protein WA955_15780 [Diaphorobacter nitroreducens]|uniref:hypothetical protein n=1 Tax=Diaphorobacter nitroreducens TaxID=164759 RepID=UPI003C78985E